VTEDDDGRVHCDHGERCGGCALLGRTRAEQAEHKRALVSAAFSGYRALAALSIGEVAQATALIGYRTRAKLVVSRAGAIGLFAQGSHDVVDIPRCRVLAPAVADAVATVRALLAAEPSARNALDGIDVREVLDEHGAGALVTLIGPEQARGELERLAALVAAAPHVRGVAISMRERDSPTVLGAAPQVVNGPLAVRDRLSASGPYQLVAHGSFTQAHREQAATLASRVQERLSAAVGGLSGKRVLELYAGSGGLALGLAAQGAQLQLVERYAPGLELVAQAAREQNLPPPRIEIGDATHALFDLKERGARYDAVIVNPPRTGLPAPLRSALAEIGPRAIAYVSCEPRTLARDLSHLALLGYGTTAIEPFDMLPLSASVECLALLTRAARPQLNVLYEDDALLVIDKPPFLPTTPQGGNALNLLDVVRAQRGLSELAAVHRLDAGTSGICLLAKRRDAVAGLAAALAAGEKHYLALVRGIARDKGSIRRPLLENGARHDAMTRYQRVRVLGGHSLLRVRPEQGRKHQVRRHLSGLGHPLLGDDRYGDPASNRHLERRHGLDRPFLHLAKLTLVLPGSVDTRTLEAELAPDLAAVCASLAPAPALRGVAPGSETAAEPARRRERRGRRRS
jgi:23S rRNA (uracil1939-C5)-methyltransferase